MTGSKHIALALAAILVCALALRLSGIGFGFPLSGAHPDERAVTYEGASVAGGNFRPSFFNYPSLFMYAVGVVDAAYCARETMAGRSESMHACAATWRTNWEPFFLAARFISALSGTLTVLAVFVLGRRLFDLSVGLAAATCLAVLFLHVRDSHFGVTDVTMTLMLVVAVALLVRAYDLATEPGDVRRFATAGLVAGFAASTKYNAVFLVAPAAVALLMRWSYDSGSPERGTALLNRWLAWSGALVLGFFMGTPYALLEPGRFWQDVSGEALHLQAGHGVYLGIGWIYHFQVTLRHGLTWPFLAAALVGVAWMGVRHPRRAALLLAFPAVYYLVAGRGYTVFARYMIPMTPFLAIAAGYFAVSCGNAIVVRWPRGSSITRSTRHAPVACALVLAVMLTPSAVKSWQLGRVLARTDSRVIAGDWIVKNIRGGASIFLTGSRHGMPDIHRLGRGPTYHYVELDGPGFRVVSGGPIERPEWIVVQESPLRTYSSVPVSIQAILPEYELVQAFRAVDMRRPHVYDQQDAWFLPLSGSRGIGRPGPNFLMYRLRARPSA